MISLKDSAASINTEQSSYSCIYGSVYEVVFFNIPLS